MRFTPEQLAADDAVVYAIDRQHRVYDDDTEGVITKYVVVAQRQWIDNEGDFRSHIYTTSPDDVSLAEALGLADFAATHYRRLILEGH